MPEKRKELKGISGWLILPIIVLFFIPLKNIIYLFTNFLPFYAKDYWLILTTPESPAYHKLWAPVIIFEITGNIIFIILSILLLFFFFKKNHRFPLMFILFLLANLFFFTCDFLMADMIDTVGALNNTSSLRELLISLIFSSICIPYFLRSERVRNTFADKTFKIIPPWVRFHSSNNKKK